MPSAPRRQRPPDGPRVVVQAAPTQGEARSDFPLLQIDLAELEADLQDEEWQDFLRRAKAYRQRLRAAHRLQ